MSNLATTDVRWCVAAFPAAHPARIHVVHGLSGQTIRAYCSAADATLAVLFELHDLGPLLLSVSVGSANTATSIDPATLPTNELQPFVDDLLDLERPPHFGYPT